MNYEVRLRLKALAADFSHYLQVFDEQVPLVSLVNANTTLRRSRRGRILGVLRPLSTTSASCNFFGRLCWPGG